MTTHATPTVETSVGELVTQRPSRSRVFERLGIDYCCGGKRPLTEMCAEKNLDAETVLTVLLEAESGSHEEGPDWAGATLTELADHIEATHHAYLKRELPRLGAMVRKVAMVHGDRHPWMREINELYFRFAPEMEAHMQKEEQKLFPMIRSLESGAPAPAAGCGPGVRNPIRVMELEHDDSGAALHRMRELSNDYAPPADACNTFRAMLDGLSELETDTHQHVHKENSILFPRALEREQENEKTAPA